ncbi:MAG: isochorismate synthase [Lepagella sp.]
MNIYAYRLPDTKRIKAYCSDLLLEGITTNSFLISPFGINRKVMSIPCLGDITLEELDLLMEREYERSQAKEERSTTRGEHKEMVERTIAAIRNGKLDKCVMSRIIVEEGTLKISQLLKSLSDANPGAFIFMFHTAEHGTWVGASPEILLQKRGNEVRSMALAGTRAVGSEEEWSDKNVAEQRIVADYISRQFTESGIEPTVSAVTTHRAGNVEHLMTEISGRVRDLAEAERLADRLSPTPALAGYPVDAAIEHIAKTETFDRGCYGGYCGVCDRYGDLSLYVNLRSLRIEKDHYTLYVGGGIMPDSDPDYEWQETEMKSLTIRDALT